MLHVDFIESLLIIEDFKVPVQPKLKLMIWFEKKMENLCWSCMYFVFICCQVAQYHCHPAEGAFVWRKRTKVLKTTYLVPCDGEFHAYPRWVCGYFTNNIFSCFYSHSRRQPSSSTQGRLMDRRSLQHLAVDAVGPWWSLIWKTFFRKCFCKKSTHEFTRCVFLSNRKLI